MKENIDRNWAGDIEKEEDEIYKENILDHFRYPHNFGKLDKYTFKHLENNPVCGDKIEIFVLLKDDIIKDIKFSGSGCAISIASTSMLTDKLKELSLDEAKKTGEKAIIKMLGINLGVVRRKCGLLGLKAILNGINKVEIENEQIRS